MSHQLYPQIVVYDAIRRVMKHILRAVIRDELSVYENQVLELNSWRPSDAYVRW